MKKENKVKPLPAPESQICPDCGAVWNENKWGGCGKCSCGYYFHPEWYGTSKKKCEETNIPDPGCTEEELIEQARKYGKIK